MRSGELLGLQRSDIDTARETLTVRHTLLRVGGELRLCPPKTEDSERTLPLLGLVADALAEHRKLQRAERAAAGERWVTTDHVFTTKIGTPIEPDNLRRFWLPLRCAVGLDGVVFHGLRHTIAGSWCATAHRAGHRGPLGDRGHDDDLRACVDGGEAACTGQARHPPDRPPTLTAVAAKRLCQQDRQGCFGWCARQGSNLRPSA